MFILERRLRKLSPRALRTIKFVFEFPKAELRLMRGIYKKDWCSGEIFIKKRFSAMKEKY